MLDASYELVCYSYTVHRHVPAATLRAPQQHDECTWMGVILAYFSYGKCVGSTDLLFFENDNDYRREGFT